MSSLLLPRGALELLTDAMLRIAQGEDRLTPPTSDSAEVDALVVGLGMLAEEVEQCGLERERCAELHRTQVLSQMAAGLAHDLNNFLGIILSVVATLQIAERRDDELQRDLKVARDAAQQAAALVRQLMLHAKRESSAAPGRLELSSALQSLRDMLEQPLESRVRLSMLTPERPLYAVIGSLQLSQLVLNLVLNARDSIEGDAGHIELCLSTLKVPEPGDENLASGGYALITVTDNGVGMPHEVLKRAFEPFFSRKLAREGTGLGLAVCREIVANAGGRIFLESEPGRGTVARVYLPIDELATLPL